MRRKLICIAVVALLSSSMAAGVVPALANSCKHDGNCQQKSNIGNNGNGHGSGNNGADWQPPGQAKKTQEDWQPPGQAKKTEDNWQPPGQAKKEGGWVPPGQAKKEEAAPVVPVPVIPEVIPAPAAPAIPAPVVKPAPAPSDSFPLLGPTDTGGGASYSKPATRTPSPSAPATNAPSQEHTYEHAETTPGQAPAGTPTTRLPESSLIPSAVDVTPVDGKAPRQSANKALPVSSTVPVTTELVTVRAAVNEAIIQRQVESSIRKAWKEALKNRKG